MLFYNLKLEMAMKEKSKLARSCREELSWTESNSMTELVEVLSEADD
jgi:hypothetical protein